MRLNASCRLPSAVPRQETRLAKANRMFVLPSALLNVCGRDQETRLAAEEVSAPAVNGFVLRLLPSSRFSRILRTM